ncbi:MAG: glycosyltransferase family 39 protein [Acidimicrobiales bacterium]
MAQLRGEASAEADEQEAVRASAPAPDGNAAVDAGIGIGRDRSMVVPLVALCAAAFVAGLWGLQSRAMWLDESLSLAAARNLIHSLLNDGSSMGPYLSFLKPWSWVSTSEWWLRLPSLLAAVAAIPVLYRVGLSFGSKRYAFTAATFLALAWLTVRYEQEARAYAWVLLLATISWLLFIESVRRGPDLAGRWWTAYFAVTVLMVLTHGLAILQLGAQVLVLLAAPQAARWRGKAVPVLVASAVAMLAMIVPGGGEAPQWIKPLSFGQVAEQYRELTGASAFAQVLIGACLVLGAVALVRRRRTATDPFAAWLPMVALSWAVIPPLGQIAVSTVHPLMVPRYVIGSAAGIALVLAAGVDAIRPRWGRWALTGLLVATLAAGQLRWHTQPQDDWRGVAGQIEAQAEPGDALFLPDPFTRPPLDYLWLDGKGAPQGLEAATPLDPIGSLPRFYRVPDATDDELAEQVARSDYDRLWIVDQHDHDLVDKVPHLEANAAFASSFRQVSKTSYDGGITVYLFVRR